MYTYTRARLGVRVRIRARASPASPCLRMLSAVRPYMLHIARLPVTHTVRLSHMHLIDISSHLNSSHALALFLGVALPRPALGPSLAVGPAVDARAVLGQKKYQLFPVRDSNPCPEREKLIY